MNENWDLPNYLTLIVEVIVGIGISWWIYRQGKLLRKIWDRNRKSTLISLFSIINASFSIMENMIETLKLPLQQGIPEKIDDYSLYMSFILDSQTICQNLWNNIEEKIKFEGKELDYQTLDKFRNITRYSLLFLDKLANNEIDNTKAANLYISYIEARRLFLELKTEFPNEWNEIVKAHKPL